MSKVLIIKYNYIHYITRELKKIIILNQTFEWPVARPAEAQEEVKVQLYNYNKYLSNKLIATYTLLMQYLIEQGELTITESFTDSRNMIIMVFPQ